jgi:uncharacterized membrane protein
MYNDGPDSGSQGRRPWFGPKRFGYGSRPQTWQGFLIVIAAAAILITVATITGGHSAWTILGAVPLIGVAIFARSTMRRR